MLPGERILPSRTSYRHEFHRRNTANQGIDIYAPAGFVSFDKRCTSLLRVARFLVIEETSELVVTAQRSRQWYQIEQLTSGVHPACHWKAVTKRMF